MRKIYLAARYSRHKEMARYAKIFIGKGYEITSRWIHGEPQFDAGACGGAIDEKQAAEISQLDYEDLCAADTVISFTEPARTATRGGRHVEFGMAVAMNKTLHVIGEREHIFHWLPQVNHWAKLDDLLDTLTGPDKPQSETALDEAKRLVHGDRQNDYGHPIDDYTRTAALWSGLLSDKLREELTAEEAIKCMILVKLSRDQNRPKRDNRVDGAGYFECLQMVTEERKRRESVKAQA